MTILLTGAAGFIGMDTAQQRRRRGDTLVGIDNLNDWYDVGLKHARLACLAGQGDFFRLIGRALAGRAARAALFGSEGFERVIHRGAQAGVRCSLLNPNA